jgi:hypothetical protein
MARRREEIPGRTLERGAIEFLYRPRVEAFQPEGLEDVQRLLIVLCPEGGRRYRVIAIGRKKMPRNDRFWGFVDLVLYSPQDLRAALGAQTYATKTRGMRHLPAALPAARGTYTLEWHDAHAHLRWDVDVGPDVPLDPSGDAIVTVANPDPIAWGLLEMPPLQFDLFDEAELHVTIPTPFPPELQSRFGDRRFVQLDTTEWLDHPGAELVFITSSRARAEARTLPDAARDLVASGDQRAG